MESAKEPPRDADVSPPTSVKIKEEATIANIQASPPAPSSSSLSGRRGSAISISSLQRQPFALKLDLTSLRISAEEAAMFSSSGLASPVTLAPKSARAMGSTEFPPELMAAFSEPSTVAADVSGRPVDIDLTIPDALEPLHPNVGDSSDKPIELDLDGMDIDMPIMTDLFGDADGGGSDHVATPADGLFSPVLGDENTESDEHPTAPNQHEGLINQLVDDNASSGVFATSAQENMTISQIHIPSPGALLASFSSNDAPPSKIPHAGSGTDPTFDLNSMELGFFPHPADSEMNFSMDMGDFLGIQGDVEEKSDANLSSKG